MKKLKKYFSGALRARILLATLIVGLAIAPTIYAQFTRLTGDPIGYGYGYGYGYGNGVGTDDGGYRISGGAASNYEYDYGYGNREAVQLTISTPSVTTSKVYNGSTAAAVTAGTLAGVVDGETVTVSASATYNSASVGTGKTITVVYTLDGADEGNYIKPIDYTVSGTITSASSGGGGGSPTPATVCTSVTYGDYSLACFAGYQYRGIDSRTPANCTLTTAQMDAAKKVCGTNLPDVTGEVPGTGITSGESNNSANFIALEKNLVKKINKALAQRLAGRILLQVEGHGESWYVNPTDLLRYYMGRPADAFAMMRKFGLGVSEKDYNSFVKNGVPARLSGRILLRVQAHGEAYYISPTDGKMSYMGRPADAFALMRKFGLGINNTNLRQIGVGEIK